MNPGDTVVNLAGRAMLLDDRIGGGGEGHVFALRDKPGRAVKIYHDRHRASRKAKIGEMVRRKLHDRSDLVAFPLEIVSSPRGDFLGFVMRRVREHRPLLQLWVPSDRLRHFPDADFRFVVRTAANVARAMAAVHFAGCVIGDINESGLLVSQQATVALIDADSFQVGGTGTAFRCTVGKPDYTAPELRGASLSGVTRTQNHDAFGLATVIFQLLFLGRLPYAGVPTAGAIDLDHAIREHRFAYSLRRDTGLAPPRGTVLLTDLSPMLAAAFDAAFAPVGSIGLRPRAMEWVDYLTRFEDELVPCPRSPRHVFHPHAGDCTWCRIAGETRVDQFR